MATDLMVTLEDRPGELARLGEALGGAGVNVDGFCATTGGGGGQVHVLVDDAGTARQALEGAGINVASEREVLVADAPNTPGELGKAARRLGDAGVNIEVAFPTADGKLVFGVDDLSKAQGAI
jgi:hypothetical protein